MRQQRWWDSNRARRKARKMDKSAGRLKQRTIFCFVFLMVLALYLVQYSLFGPDESDQIERPIAVDSQKQQQEAADDKNDPCGGRYVYMHDLPPMFNEEMLRECKRLSPWIDMCKFIVNAGLGPPLENTEAVFSNSGWYATNQFSMDVIFHNRMKRYECLTNDSSLAAVIYVPFYAGLDISRHLWGHNVSVRDSASLALVDWLVSRPEWNVMNGHDHFLVGGRITWDFRRRSDEESDWGNKLMSLPAVKKMTMLVLESSPWENNDMAIPYPTYFHPSRFSEIADWQKRVRSFDRKYLFSFAGAPRPEMGSSIRGKIMEQCRNSKVGMLLECDLGQSKCQSPSAIMKMFSRSVFCLQPQGDSYTRRSLFDSMLAGCIPVLFHPGSAYTQYFWHLPKNHTTYSVFISENDVREYNVSIEEILLRISAEQVKRMREEVIKLIPKIVYADPRSKIHGFKDAFDVSVESVVDKVARLRKELFVEEDKGLMQNTRKWDGERAWDEFFSMPKDEGSGQSRADSVGGDDNNNERHRARKYKVEVFDEK